MTTTVTTSKTPADILNDRAEQAGVTLPYGSGSVYEQVERACSWLAEQPNVTKQKITMMNLIDVSGPGTPPDPQLVQAYRLGMPSMCPQWLRTLDAVLAGGTPLWPNETYEVGTKFGQVRPGTYRTTDSVSNCYWERTAPDGEALDNNFVTHAREIKVTIRSTDGSFTSQRCGYWEQV